MSTSIKTLGVALGALLLASTTALADEQGAPAARVNLTLQQDPDRVTIITPAAGGATSDETYQTMNSEVLVGGVVLFGASYGAAAIAASQSERDADRRLYVPLVGPWLDLADRGDCPIENQSCDDETTNKVLIIGDGVLQAAGALLILDAALFPRTVHRTSTTATALRHVKPIRVGDGGRGVALRGTF